MSIPYLITFTPVGRFYFGSSQSFGEGFFAASFQFPSQTTILGTIRAAILQQNGCLELATRQPIGEYEKHTGTSPMRGFDEEINEFGKIIKMSPVFMVLRKETDNCPTDFLFPVPADIFFEYDGNKNDEDGDPLVKRLCQYEFRNTGISNNRFCGSQIKEHSYSYTKRIKENHAEYLGGLEFWQAYKNNAALPYKLNYLSKKIFISNSQPGIARRNRLTVDKHYYRKNDYSLAEDYAFGIIVHFTEENVLEDKIVFMGGERSQFKMKVKKIPLVPSHILLDHPIVNRFINEKDYGDYSAKEDSTAGKGKYLLISDFFANGEIRPDYALISNLHAVRSIDGNGKKTDTFRAIPAGSILFTENKLAAASTYNTSVTIGYNFTIKF
jgi:CRISPR-associated protein Cmr3